MDQNQWFNTGSPAPMNDRQAFEAGWTAAQRQTALQCYKVRCRSDGNVHKCKNAHWGDNCYTT